LQHPRQYVQLSSKTTGAPFSDAVLVGSTLYIAGQIGVDSATGMVPQDAHNEITFLFQRIKSILQEVGMGLEHIVFLQVSCADQELYDLFNDAYSRLFNGHYPARSFVVAGGLVKNARFHISATAVR
jgi:2-iminobutanoate/2-iminopropanoate deaminase